MPTTSLLAVEGLPPTTCGRMTLVHSGGIGVKPWWRETDTARPGRQVDVLAYAFVWQHNVDWSRRWHMMALVIPLVWQ
jgi:hypothetical protein